MAKAKLTLEGFDDFFEILQKAEKDIDQVSEEALDAGADVFVSGMQRRAPFPRIRVRIRKSKIGRDGNKRYIYVGVLRDTPAEDARVANVYEFGGPAKESGKHPGRHHRRIQAHPYIRPALRQDANKAKAAMEKVFRRWLEK